jgi:hypothetical protein
MALTAFNLLATIEAVNRPLLGARSLAPGTGAGSHPLFSVVLTD